MQQLICISCAIHQIWLIFAPFIIFIFCLNEIITHIKNVIFEGKKFKIYKYIFHPFILKNNFPFSYLKKNLHSILTL